MSVGKLRSWSLAQAFVLGAAVSAAAGCSSTPPSAEASGDDITDVQHTSTKGQTIGNCWVYATVGWAESLNKSATNADADFSETYVSYWDWFDKIAGGTTDLNPGGFWGDAIEILGRRGVINEGDFIPEESAAANSVRQKTALNAIKESIANGALKDPQAKRNGAIVRQELDKAFGLNADVIAMLDNVFGKAGERTLDRNYASGALPGGAPIKRTSEIPAALTNRQGGTKVGTLADAIGSRASGTSAWQGLRDGEFAWGTLTYPKDNRRQYLKRAQRALHARQPVLMIWSVDFNALDPQGRFMEAPATPSEIGSHMTVLEDYQVENVPGFGTLPAGVDEQRPEALNAALDDSATVTFFRIKNSWGDYKSVPDFSSRGYHDLYLKYLDGPIKNCPKDKPNECRDIVPLQELILPRNER